MPFPLQEEDVKSQSPPERSRPGDMSPRTASFFRRFASPRDVRWRSRAKWGPAMLLPICAAVALNWVFTAAMLIYVAKRGHGRASQAQDYQSAIETGGRYWTATSGAAPHLLERVYGEELASSRGYGGSSGTGEFIGVPFDYGCGGGCVAANILARTTILLVETVHLPTHIALFLTSHLHPVASLAVSIILALAWAIHTVFFAILDDDVVPWSGRYDPAWYGLGRTRLALALLCMALYAVYVGCASYAVREWRKARGEVVRVGLGVEREGPEGQAWEEERWRGEWACREKLEKSDEDWEHGLGVGIAV